MPDIEPVCDTNLYDRDKDFCESVKNRIAEHIISGLTPIEAAKRVGVSPVRFKIWLNTGELFRNFVDGAVQERNANLKSKALEILDEKYIDEEGKDHGYVMSANDRFKGVMDFLKHTDKEFGAKHVNTKGIEVKLTASPANCKEIETSLSEFDISSTEEEDANQS